MAIRLAWSLTAIIAVSAGGSLFILATMIVVVLLLRFQKKHRSSLAQTARVRRLSRYPGGNLSITSSQIDHLPTLGRVRQGRYSRGPYGLLGRSRAADSRDTLSRRSYRSGTSKTTVTTSYIDLHHPANLISWPLTPASAYARGTASTSVLAHSLSPIGERCYDSQEHNAMPKAMLDNTPGIGPYNGFYCEIDSNNKLSNIHGHRRSISTGVLDSVTQALNRSFQGEEDVYVLAPDSRPRPTVKRTLSLRTQRSGNAPLHRMDSPPPDVPRYSRVQALRSHPADGSIRNSLGSITSTNSSSYDEIVRSSDIESSSMSVAVDHGNSKRGGVMMENAKLWDISKLAADIDPSTVAHFRPQLQSYQSFRSSIEQSTLSRSASSGLSCSLVDQYGPSRNVSNASRLVMFNKDLFRNPQSNGAISPYSRKGIEKDAVPRQQFNESTNPIAECTLGMDMPMRASTSVLQDISGNKGIFAVELNERPSSVPISRPFKWDNVRPGKPSALKARSEGHKRQDRQRISFVQARPRSALFTTSVVELDESSETHTENQTLPSLLLTSPEYSKQSPRPPSIAIFEPQLKKHCSPKKSPEKYGRDYSATMSVCNMYEMDHNNSVDELTWTPTKKPSAERRYTRQFGKLQDKSANNTWPLQTGHEGSRPLSAVGIDIPMLGPGSPIRPLDEAFFTDSSTHLPFPEPPSKQPKKNPPEWRLPRHLKGPRAAPARRSPTRRSPHKASPLRQTTRSPTPSHHLNVEAQIMRLRKMHSGVSLAEASSNRQYLNMGHPSPAPPTPELDDGLVFELVEPNGRNGSRTVGLSEDGREMMVPARRDSIPQRAVIGLGISDDSEWQPRISWLEEPAQPG